MGLSPSPAGCLPFVPSILPPPEDRHLDHLAPLLEGPFDFVPQFHGKLVARNEDRGLRRDAGLVEVLDRQPGSVLSLLLSLVANCQPDGLGRLAQTRRAFDEEAQDALPILAFEPPEEEPLDDLARPVLGFLGGKEAGAGSLLQCVQCGPVASGSRRSGAGLTEDARKPCT